jgi:hypothetical protein
MIYILVKKSWIQEIGQTSDSFIVEDFTSDLAKVYTTKTEMEYPFVFSNLARKDLTKQGEAFSPAHIPVDAIRGIFDLTEEEKTKLGFEQ